MSSITLANLRTASLRAADMENSSFAGSAEVNRLVNARAAELHDLLVSRFEKQFTTSLQFTISSGNTYTLTSAFYKVEGLDRDEGGGEWVAVRKGDWERRNRRASGRSWYRGRDVEYVVVGSTIYLTPTDHAEGTYRLWYVPQFVDMANDSDTLDIPQNWHEYVVCGVAADLLAKEESDPSYWLGKLNALRDRILAMAANRDADGPMRIRRVRTARWGDDEDY